MPTVKKTAGNERANNNITATVERSTSHANDPYVLKKVEQAKAFLSKAGLPKFKSK